MLSQTQSKIQSHRPQSSGNDLLKHTFPFLLEKKSMNIDNVLSLHRERSRAATQLTYTLIRK